MEKWDFFVGKYDCVISGDVELFGGYYWINYDIVMLDRIIGFIFIG